MPLVTLTFRGIGLKEAAFSRFNPVTVKFTPVFAWCKRNTLGIDGERLAVEIEFQVRRDRNVDVVLEIRDEGQGKVKVGNLINLVSELVIKRD